MRNYTRMLLFVLASGCVTPAVAQSPAASDQQAIEAVINKLFLGMQRGDSAMVHATFTKELSMATVVRNKQGTPVVHWEHTLTDFLKAVGTPHKEVWYEEIWDLKISLDGDFAQAWCDYAFYVDNTFSHCGVDAFHLVKSNEGWKIFHLADTRRKEGCTIPEKIKAKHP
ncbi:MAG TPA: nuclear transport factor 2 family protein [Ohtaekwangia sp.]